MVYVDLVFLLNFAVDLATVAATAWSRRLPVRWWRLALSAAIGASYVILLFVPVFADRLFTFAVKAAVSVVMVLIAFGYGGLRHFTRNLTTFYLVNFAAGGTVYGVYFLLRPTGEVLTGIFRELVGGLPGGKLLGAGFLAMGIAAGILLFRRTFRQSHERERVERYLADVRIRFGDRLVACTGLIDTGNQLYDPLTRTPVMVVEMDVLSDFLSDGWREQLRADQVDRLLAAVDEADFALRDRLRLIPYRGVGRGTQFMLALKPDGVELALDGQSYIVRKALVGLDDGRLSSDGTYRAILHPAMVESAERFPETAGDVGLFAGASADEVRERAGG